MKTFFLLWVILCLACSSGGGSTAEPANVDVTWLGVTQWLVQYQGRTVFLDAYFSRPEAGVTGPTEDGLDRMDRILDAADVESVDLILVGHSHFDHAVDCGAAAFRTGAQVVGTSTTCLIASSEGLPEARCTEIGNDDQIEADGITVRTVRTVHFAPDSLGAFEELEEEPENVWGAPVGGVVSYLVTFDGDPPLTVFYQNSIGPLDSNDGSTEDYRRNLEEVFEDVGEIDLWLAPVDFLVAAEELDDYYGTIQPRFLIPHHFDGLAPDLEAGLATPYAPSDLVVEANGRWGTTLVSPEQYFDRFVLSENSVVLADESPIQDAFGL